jgi:hypothetical protein
MKANQKHGGEGGIRTLGTGISQYNGLANRRIRPLCHLSRAEHQFIICCLIILVWSVWFGFKRCCAWVLRA